MSGESTTTTGQNGSDRPITEGDNGPRASERMTAVSVPPCLVHPIVFLRGGLTGDLDEGRLVLLTIWRGRGGGMRGDRPRTRGDDRPAISLLMRRMRASDMSGGQEVRAGGGK